MTTTKPTHSSRSFWLGIPLLLCSGFAVFANLVTYQINMGVQQQLGNFNPGADRVLVSGNFSTPDWITTIVLTNSTVDTNVYEGTFNNDIGTGSFENHKFIIDVGSTGSALNWETGGNRFFQVTDADQVLAVVYFNNVTNANSLITTQIAFSVNMGVQISLGNFNPSSDFVYVAGDGINNWVVGASVLTNSLTDTNIWTSTFSLTNTTGNPVNYKFIMNTFANGTIWENNGVGPNGAQNRQFTFPATATNLPVVYFNNITNTSSLVATQVTFKVNLAAQIAQGSFDPISGQVSVAGDAINNWSPIMSYLTQTVTNSSVWSGTFPITNTVGGAVNYKFVLNGGGTWENNGVGPNGANDRQFIFTNMPTVLPDVYFNNLANLGNLTISPLSAGQVTVSWTAGPAIRLQTNAALLGTWGDVPGTTGASSATVGIGAGKTFFRLIGP
jgi:hypothetical protein